MSKTYDVFECPECKYKVELQDIIDDFEDEIIEALEYEIDERAEKLKDEFKDENKQHEYVYDNIKLLAEKHKYFLNGESINYLEEMLKILRDSETL